MYFSDIVKRSGRSLKSAKLRTILTALAISVGAFTLSVTLAASNGLHDYTSKLINNNFDQSELLVGRDKAVGSGPGGVSNDPQEYDSTTSSISAGARNTIQIKKISEADAEAIRSKPFISQVRENYQITINYVTRPGYRKYTGSAQAYDPSQKPEIKSGETPKSGDLQTGGVLLPESYVSLLGFASPEAAVGQTVQIDVAEPFSAASLQDLLSSKQSVSQLAANPTLLKPKEQLFSYKIVAVTKKTATSLSVGVEPVRLSSVDARTVYDFTAKGTADYNKFIYVSASVKDGTDPKKLDDAKKSLESEGFYVESSKDIEKTITQFVNILTIMVGVFGLITIVASVFGIVNTQYISVLERTREIGLMKALGISRGEISQLFMLEATWIGFLGAAIGEIVGTVLGIAINPYLTKKLELGEGNSLLIYRPLQMVGLVVALMLVATIAGLLPSRKAAKLDPIEALRAE